VFFAILFIPHAFVVVKDINFVTAYEVDPGSIILSILALFNHFYNMNAGYHSQYYGWTYFSINFFLLLPLYIGMRLKLVNDNYYMFVAIRLIFFMIGLTSVLAFFEVAKKTLKQGLLAFASVLLFIASPPVFRFFYFLHPETTGLLFLFLGILCFFRYNEGFAKDYRWYTIGLLTLVLSVLAKHIFIIMALPVLFLFLYSYCHHQNKPVFRFLITKQFIKIFLQSMILSIIVFFIINPFAFLQPAIFIKNQIYLFTAQTTGTLTQAEAINAWISILKTIPIIYISIIVFPLTLLGAMILGRGQNMGRMLYAVNIIGGVLFVAFIITTSRYIIYSGYFAPIYAFFVLNIISIPLFLIRKWNIKIIKILIIIPLVYFLFIEGLTDFSISIPTGYSRLMYQESLVYKVYDYIDKNIPTGSRITYDQYVAIPYYKGITGCFYWAECSTDYIEEFKPDYVLFVDNLTTNDVGGMKMPETARLIKYVNDHHFVLIDTIEGRSPETAEVIPLEVWKKPGN
jgi:hypothetical protein